GSAELVGALDAGRPDDPRRDHDAFGLALGQHRPDLKLNHRPGRDGLVHVHADAGERDVDGLALDHVAVRQDDPRTEVTGEALMGPTLVHLPTLSLAGPDTQISASVGAP